MINPHDRLFRLTFGDPEHARGLLRSLLPEPLRGAMDWRSLQRIDGSLVDQQLAERHTDLLFRVELAGHPAFIFLLLEHQSTVDVWMPLRMLGYVMRIWERFRDEHPEASRLPLVCPLVLHHSRNGWSGPRTLNELLDLDDALKAAAADFVPDMRLGLLDLTAHDDEQLHELIVSDIGALVASTLKHAPYDADFLQSFPTWVEAWRRATQAPGGVSALGAIARYILEVRDELAVDEFRDLLHSSVNADAAEAIMTVAEKLRQEGHAKGRAEGHIEGRAEGHTEGRAEGRVEGQAELVLKLLILRFGPLTDEVQQRIRRASIEELDRFAERVLTAQRLDQVLD